MLLSLEHKTLANSHVLQLFIKINFELLVVKLSPINEEFVLEIFVQDIGHSRVTEVHFLL